MSFLPLFSDLAEDDENDPLKPINENKVKISSEAEASPVSCVSIQELSNTIFSKDIRGVKPLVIKNCGTFWPATRDWSQIDIFLRTFEDIESTALVAKDGRNFLKNGLCCEINLPLHQILRVCLQSLTG